MNQIRNLVIPLGFILIFICGAGRNTFYPGQTAVTGDSIAKYDKQASLYKSIRDTALRKAVSGKSIELSSVIHISDTDPYEVVIFFEHKPVFTDLEFIKNEYRNSTFQMDSIFVNPFPEMNAGYVQIFCYHGQYISAFAGGFLNSACVFVSDSTVVWSEGNKLMFYDTAQKAGDKLLYKLFYPGGDMNRGCINTIEIKTVPGPLDLQLWKSTGCGDSAFFMMIREEQAAKMPCMKALDAQGHNIWLALDEGAKLNYDSLWRSK